MMTSDTWVLSRCWIHSETNFIGQGWPRMQNFTLQNVYSALKFKCKPQKAEMENMQATYPLQLVYLDYLTIEMTGGGRNVHVLIITDHFTRYAQALVTSSLTAKCTAQVLWDWFVVHCGLPESIISDQDPNFKSDLISELCKLVKVWKLHTSPYYPQTNRHCERFNHTLINMLSTLPQNKKSSWRDMVPTLVHAYNCSRSNATGFSPYYLMYGWNPQLPVDLYLVPRMQTWMLPQVLNSCNSYGKDEMGLQNSPACHW